LSNALFGKHALKTQKGIFLFDKFFISQTCPYFRNGLILTTWVLLFSPRPKPRKKAKQMKIKQGVFAVNS
jgi:hypothetical protein